MVGFLIWGMSVYIQDLTRGWDLVSTPGNRTGDKASGFLQLPVTRAFQLSDWGSCCPRSCGSRGRAVGSGCPQVGRNSECRESWAMAGLDCAGRAPRRQPQLPPALDQHQVPPSPSRILGELLPSRKDLKDLPG